MQPPKLMTNRDRHDYASDKQERDFYINVLAFQILEVKEPHNNWHSRLIEYVSRYPEYEVSEYSGYGEGFPQPPESSTEEPYTRRNAHLLS